MGAFLQGFTVGLAYVMPIGAQNIFRHKYRPYSQSQLSLDDIFYRHLL